MDMRKDSEMFLKKILDYRNNIGKNNFELNFQYFNDIPSIETAIYIIIPLTFPILQAFPPVH